MTTSSFPIPRLTVRVAALPLRRAAVVALTALAVATPAAAQVPADSALRAQQRAIDSLVAVVRGLQLRLDSLARLRLDTGLGDDLGALRAAAAAAAAGPDTSALAVPAGPRGQNLLNPEISVTGDFRAVLVRPGPQTETFDPHEFEFSFQSALDPLSASKIFVGLHDGEIDVEEGYVYWTGLPGHLRLDLGKFRQTVGELNRWHLHALPEGEYPLVLQRYLGEEGLAQTGVSVSLPLPVAAHLGAYELTAQVTKGTNAALFGPYGDRPSYLGNLSGFWQLGRAVFAQLGVTGLVGEGHDSVTFNPPCPLLSDCRAITEALPIQSRLRAVAVRVSWRPPADAQRREVTLRGELFEVRREVWGEAVVREGVYAAASFRLGRRWIAGVRGDWVETTDLASPRRSEWAVSPTLTFWQSEFVYLRLQWTRHRDLLGATTDRIGIQAVWAMGPHKHEMF